MSGPGCQGCSPVMLHHDIEVLAMPDNPELELLNSLAAVVTRYVDRVSPRRRHAVAMLLAELEAEE